VATQLIFAIFNALSMGMAIFMVAAGITLIFGLLKILNMAQGAFFMIGAYIAFSLIDHQQLSLLAFIGVALLAGLGVAVLGLLTDRLILSRLRHVDYHYMLIATFALMMVCQGAVKLIWGVNFFSVMPPLVLDQPLQIGTLFLSRYSLFVIAAGLVIYVILEVAIHRLWLGKLMQSLASNPWMSGLLGINVSLGLTFSVMFAFFLAGLAGGLMLPLQSLSPQLGDAYLLYGFFAIIIGGLGNVRGALLGSILLGLVNSLNTILLPEWPGIAIYVVLAVFLFFRPEGLFPSLASQPQSAGEQGSSAMVGNKAHRPAWMVAGALVVVLAASLPLWANGGLLYVAGSAIVYGLFALSWNILFGYTGLASFGHSAFFAIGAYFTGVLLRDWPQIPFLLVLLGCAVFGAVVACLVGALALRRLAGIFLAVLTIALAEVTRLLISYSDFLGREDGLVGIPRPKLAWLGFDLDSSAAYYWFLLAAVVLLVAVLWWVLHGRFGRLLLITRQDPERAAFLGVNVTRVRTASFMLSGAVAAVAGGLYAPWARIVTLEQVSFLASTQPVLNAMLGGVHSFWGPMVGAVIFAVLEYGTRTFVGLSEIMVGALLLLIILAAPNGVVGLWRAWASRARTYRATHRPRETEPESGEPLRESR
tara:strand:+ start:7723 stop:9663 length:1941 start_codon:yes stop_codon:yes gene_type:complete